MKGPSRPVPVVEDVAVPPEGLSAFLVRMQNVLKRNQITASLLCHAGHGQLHIQPFLDLDDPADVQRMRQAAEELYQEVFDAGGTIGGEHAYGFSRTPFLARQIGPLYDVLRQVKQIFDPGNILNPGKIVGDDPELLTRYLRPALGRGAATAAAARRGRLAQAPRPDRVATGLGPFAGQRGHGDLQPLRRVPFAIAAGADVPAVPLRAGRGGIAAGQGQHDPRLRHPQHRSEPLDQR